MDVAIESNVDIRVTQNLAECLNVKADFNASSGKCMTCSVEIYIADICFQEVLFKFILHGSGLNVLVLIPS